MKNKLLSRLLCALLSVLMLVCMIPVVALPTFAAEEKTVTVGANTIPVYESAEARLAAMEKMYTTTDGRYSLYCDKTLGVVAYTDNTTGEILFTNPWDIESEVDSARAEMLSQIKLTYTKGGDKTPLYFNSFEDAAMKGQISVKYIKGGIRVEYAIGILSSRVLVPRQLTEAKFKALDKEFKSNIDLNNQTQKDLYTEWRSLYSSKATTKLKGFRDEYPYLAKQYEQLLAQYGSDDAIPDNKHVSLYVLATDISENSLRRLEAAVKTYLPEYSFEEMDEDHLAVDYFEETTSPALFRMALEYTLDGNGLSVSLPANGLRYDETVYRVTDLQILPYMGAGLKSNEGYYFVPDGSGALYETNARSSKLFYLYGPDYALSENLRGQNGEVVRMPVFGQLETLKNEEGEIVDQRGFLAIIEEGDSLASLKMNNITYSNYAMIAPSFVTRETDTSASNWPVYAYRRYTEDYTIRYVLLSDHESQEGKFDCTWMGMARAYRAYLDGKDNGFERLTETDVKTASIPLYIESFGCMDTIEKVLSMPVTVSVALTSFDDIETMYEYLAGQNVTNVHFKMTGYANGGLYADVPYKLKWAKSVGGKGGFEDLTEYAAGNDLSLYPDFDFVYTSQADGGSAVRMKQNAARTIDNRYTSRRVYSVTKQDYVSYYQMVLSPATYSKFYEKLVSKYEKYTNATGVSLSTMGSELNSDYSEDQTVLREESKEYVLETLSYFGDRNYDIMVEGGNAFVWNKVDHIIDAPLDSSRYTAEYASIPFLGVVLHGYVQFAGSALNMEGDMQYALLKAIENGAAAYFILSYANTDLLKEDELLSQNYSVRYDIWQKQLISTYNELNALLADVQTKLIIDHEFLNGTRIPDESEIKQDIINAAKQQAAMIEQAIKEANEALRKELRLAIENAASAKTNIDAYTTSITNYFRLISGQRTNADGTLFAPDKDNTGAYLYNAWVALRGATGNDVALAADSLEGMLDMYVVQYYVGAGQTKSLAANTLLTARNGYLRLIEENAAEDILTEAKEGIENAVDAYVALLETYTGNKTLTVTSDAKEKFCTGVTTVEELEAAILATATEQDLAIDAADVLAYLFKADTADATKYTAYANLSVGIQAIYDAYVQLLVEDGFYTEGASSTSLIDLDQLVANRTATSGGSGNDEDEDLDGDKNLTDNTAKYAIDNKIVCVTYGEENDPYKTFILNFNDYAVQTTYNGITYTIDGYGYVVIMHD